MSDLTLGLDVGPNSLGWALVSADPPRLVDCGVRVFPEGVDQFETQKEAPPNEARRIARGMRRQIRRRAVRKRLLRNTLIELGLLPSDPGEREQLYTIDPYALRARALDEPLTAHQLGRVLLHLNQRRGFFSNRKRERKDKEVKGMLDEISELETEIKRTSRTLGEFLHRKAVSLDHCRPRKDDHIRRRHTRRQMLLDEFDAIWKAQVPHHRNLLTDELRYGSAGPQKQPHKPSRRCGNQALLEAFGIEGLLFFQRPIYWPRSVVGTCELEPKQKRCPRGDRRAQRFRVLQEVNNLRYIDPDTGEENRLDEEQHAHVLEKLAKKDKMTFDEMRGILGLAETARFNLEEGRRTRIQGMTTDHAMASRNALGAAWHKMSEDNKNAIVALLAQSTDDDETHEVLVRQYGLTSKQADAALGVELPTGYVNLSVVAIEKLLPHLERRMRLMGNDESDSAMHAAGYMRRDQLQRQVFDKLPDPARTRDARIGDIPNPVVKRALVELRKLVNAIIREYGKPSAVHVEMARNMKPRPKPGTDGYRKYMRRIEAMRERERRRDDAKAFLRDHDQPYGAGGANILKVLLWEQQDRECIYCGDTISQAQLFSGEIHVDHILPYSRSLDDSQMNKVVCHGRCNTDKTNNTPHEWLADRDPPRYERLCQHALSLVRKGLLPYRKFQRLTQKELKLDDFIARQLTATGYIARATGEYLRCLFEHDHDVLGLKGELTAELRHQWGLGDVLSSLPDSPAWQEQSALRPGEKNRADHRHHAIDAIVVALTNRSRLQKLSRIRKEGGVRQTGEALPFPWDGFRDDVIANIKTLNVSRRAKRKVAGALHEDTLYSPTEEPGVFVVRKPLESLSPNEVPLIRDGTIRRIIEQHLADHGIEIGRGKKADPKKWRAAMSDVTMPSGVPIKKVRVCRNEKTIQPIREGTPHQAYVKPGSTHHLALFEWEENGKRKREADFVTMLQAIDRLKRGESIIQRTPSVGHPRIPPYATFRFSLSRGEMVLADWKGEQKLLVFKTAASTQGQVYFALQTDARRSSDQTKFVATANSLNARKVTVDLLGRIRWAND